MWGSPLFRFVAIRLLKTFATVLQVPRETFWRLQRCCKSSEKLFGVCNGVARVPKNFLAFATVLQVLRKTFWCLQRCCKSPEKTFVVCNGVANPSRNFLVFAGVPEVSREIFWCLRESRKCHEKLFGVCGSPASVTRNFLAFAGVPQVSRETFWCLRESRKCLEKLFGVCGSPASVSRNFLAFAGVPQTFSVFLSAIKQQLPMRLILTGRVSLTINTPIWYRWYGIIRSGSISSPGPAFRRSCQRGQRGGSCPCSYAGQPRCRRSCPG